MSRWEKLPNAHGGETIGTPIKPDIKTGCKITTHNGLSTDVRVQVQKNIIQASFTF
jgi:hypothetical protein